MLVDLDWPMHDSLEVIAGLLETEPSLPVVAATSMPRSAEIAQLLESSLVTVLEKPLQWTEFQRGEREAVGRFRAGAGDGRGIG